MDSKKKDTAREAGKDAPIEKKDFKKLVSDELAEIMGDKKLEIGSGEKKLLKEEGRENLEGDLLRLQAEFENFKKRCEKETRESREYGKMEIVIAQLSFIDEFETSLSHLKGGELAGMKMVFENFKKILHSHGLREMECLGKKYDPYKHEAILMQESEKEPGTILEVARKGYMFKESVVRHAQVIVAKKKEAMSPSGGAPPKVLQPKQPPIKEYSFF